MTITILTDSHEYEFDSATDWSRDDTGNLYVYDGSDTLASFDAGQYVGILLGDAHTRQLRQ
jgi:hypothetical protein